MINHMSIAIGILAKQKLKTANDHFNATELKLYKYIVHNLDKLDKMEVKNEGNLRIDGQPWCFS